MNSIPNPNTGYSWQSLNEEEKKEVLLSLEESEEVNNLISKEEFISLINLQRPF